MGSFCLSSTSILRCEYLSQTESVSLIVPTAIELFFATSLIFTNRGSGWRHLLLTAEGWTYFIVALLDLLSHNVPAARQNLSVFSSFDRSIAVLAFLPLFLYISFFLIFSRAELVNNLPARFQRIASTTLLLFAPTILILSVVASFVGISYRVADGNILIGFRTDGDQNLWQFFTSITLALFTVYQAVIFCLLFFRLVKAFINRKRIESTSSEEIHLFKGIGWLALGVKFGALETIIGFAQDGYGIAITRRFLHLLSRACIIIGVVIGVDTVEDFQLVRNDLRRKLPMISNPRYSTFQHLASAEPGESSAVLPDVPAPASEPEDMRQQTAPTLISSPRRLSTFSQGSSPRALVNPRAAPAPPFPLTPADSAKRAVPVLISTPKRTSSFGFLAPPGAFTQPRPAPVPVPSLPDRNQRVTVHFDGRRAPTLQVRFSALGLPAPEKFLQRPQSMLPSPSVPSVPEEPESPAAPAPALRTRSLYARTPASVESIVAVRELTEQFPGLPPLAQRSNSTPVRKSGSLSKRRPVPSMPPLPRNPFDDGSSDHDAASYYAPATAYYKPRSIGSDEAAYSAESPIERFDNGDGRPTSRYSNDMSVGRPLSELSTDTSPFDRDSMASRPVSEITTKNPFDMRDGGRTTDDATDDAYASNYQSGTTSGTASPRMRPFSMESSLATSPESINFKYDYGDSIPRSMHPSPLALATPPAPPTPQVLTPQALDTPTIAERAYGGMDLGDSDEEGTLAAEPRPALSRIKSVGKAPRRNTPAPVQTGVGRESMSIDRILTHKKSPSGQRLEIHEDWVSPRK